jgi:hypothetical protein
MPKSTPFVKPEVRGVQVIPSGLVRIVPFVPTATNWLPDQAMPRSILFVKPEVRGVQVIPFGLVRIAGALVL